MNGEFQRKKKISHCFILPTYFSNVSVLLTRPVTFVCFLPIAFNGVG